MNKTNLAAAIMLLLPHFSTAQNWSAVVQIGSTGYQGDVNEHFLWTPNLRRVAISGGFAYQIFDAFNLRLNVSVGQLSGSDLDNATTDWRQKRAMDFQTPFVESSILAEWDILKTVFGEDVRYEPSRISTYSIVGVGVTWIQPKPNFNEPNPIADAELIDADKKTAINRFQPVLPYGLGAKWQVSQFSTIRLEAVMRQTFSDYFDGISKCASFDRNDAYITVMIGWEQKIYWRGGRTSVSSAPVRCPKF